MIVSFVDFGGIVKFNNNNVLKLYRNERKKTIGAKTYYCTRKEWRDVGTINFNIL